MYAIAGVTGHTGAVVAESLLAKGQPIRVIVRDEHKGAAWRTRGAEIAVASLHDDAAMAHALSGATGAYLLLPPDATTTDFFGSRARMIEAIGRAAVQAGLPHLVFLSSIGAHVPKGQGIRPGLGRGQGRSSRHAQLMSRSAQSTGLSIITAAQRHSRTAPITSRADHANAGTPDGGLAMWVGGVWAAIFAGVTTMTRFSCLASLGERTQSEGGV